ncbi:MAG: transposase [Bacteroidota bacterium]
MYNRGINRTSIFRSVDNYNFFLKKWEMLIHPFLETYCFCLMPNHFHFIVKVRPYSKEIKRLIEQIDTSKSRKFLAEEITYNEFLEDQFKRILSSYTLAFNKQQKRTGSLFQKRFKRIGIRYDHKLLNLIAYIHHNPIHHGFTRNYSEWKFNSYQCFTRNFKTFIDSKMVLSLFHKDLKKAKFLFHEFHQEYKYAFTD